MRSSTGTGLIELATIIAILAILATIAIPRWYGASIEDTNALDKLSHTITLAQYTAINRGVTTYITLNNQSYQAFAQMTTGPQPLSQPITITQPTTLTSTTEHLAFQAITGLPVEPYTIILMATQNYTLTIDSLGELTITTAAEAI